MKYIISESQYELLNEINDIQRLKRRVNIEELGGFIETVVNQSSTKCEDFGDEFSYAENMIGWAVDDFLSIHENVFNDNSYDDIHDMLVDLCKQHFGGKLMEDYFTNCAGSSDTIFEQSEIGINNIIIKLFKILNQDKKKVKTRKQLLELIKKYSPLMNIPKGYEVYLLELYTLNYRKDGDYSNLTKDNFVDPRDMRGRRTQNADASLYTKAQLPFRGSNLEGYWKTKNGKKYYVVESWGWYPVFIYKDGIWYENVDRYSNSTSRQIYSSQPYDYNNTLDSKVYLLTRDEMAMIENGYSHDEVMKVKRDKLKKLEPELKSKKVSIERTRTPEVNIKFKINSVEEEGDTSIVNVDIFDVIRREGGKSVPTPENYLKGELPNTTPEKIESQLTNRLIRDFSKYLGPKFQNKDKQNVEFRFNHLKK